MSFFSSFFSSSSETNLTTAKTILSTAAAITATALLIRSVANELLPINLHNNILTKINPISSRFSTDLTMVIEEFEGLDANRIYQAAETYLGTIISSSTQRLIVSKSDNLKTLNLTMKYNQSVTDYFRGVKLQWLLRNPNDLTTTLNSEIRSLELTFNRKHRDMVLNTYIPFILQEAESKKQEVQDLKIFTIDTQYMFGNFSPAWVGSTLDNSTTFDTLAVDRCVGEFVMEDLRRFVERKGYYRSVGKPWKRGYLLYGPPGTGKSSLIVAMANYLHFDIYDLEVSELSSTAELRRLLIAMRNRSIVVVENIDRSVHHDRQRIISPINHRQVTISGLQNLIDGLWSSWVDERIIVFTTNHWDNLDPGLMRAGRMDVHILVPYCSAYAFRKLAFRYLGIKEHFFFQEIESTIRSINISAAEVVEQLLKGNDIYTTLKDLADYVRLKGAIQELHILEEIEAEESHGI